MRRLEAGRGAAPAGLVATRHSGGIGAPPGATRSPCQELADGSVGALARDGPDESRARCRKRRDWRAAKAPACRKARAIRILRFSARHPPSSSRRAEGPVSKDRGKFPQNRTRDASRQGASMPNPAVKRACHMEEYSCLNAGIAPQTRQYCRTACRKCGAIQQGSLSGTVRASRHPAVSASISV